MEETAKTWGRRRQHPDAYSDWKIRANQLDPVEVTLPREQWNMLLNKMRGEAVESPTYDRCAVWVRLVDSIGEQVR